MDVKTCQCLLSAIPPVGGCAKIVKCKILLSLTIVPWRFLKPCSKELGSKLAEIFLKEQFYVCIGEILEQHFFKEKKDTNYGMQMKDPTDKGSRRFVVDAFTKGTLGK